MLAFLEGAVGEIMIDGQNGFHVHDEQHMVQAIGRVDEIDPSRCRKSIASRYDALIVAEQYQAVYHRTIQAAAQGPTRLIRRGPRAHHASGSSGSACRGGQSALKRHG